MKKLAIIHTSPATVEPLRVLAKELFPQIPVLNWVDDSILPELIHNGGNLSAVEERWFSYVRYACQAGASVVLSACSSVGELAEKAQLEFPLPVLRIDRPMAEEAVRNVSRIGVIATLETTLGPTARLLQKTAGTLHKSIQLTPVLVEGAYSQLMAGNKEGHDTLLLSALNKLLSEVDVILLAQASMARVLPVLPAEAQARVISSPRSGMQAAARALVQIHD
jgi:glutamate racemase